MITAKITISDGGTRRFMVNLTAEIEDRTALNKVLGERLAEELQGHFSRKNAEGKRPGSLAASIRFQGTGGSSAAGRWSASARTAA